MSATYFEMYILKDGLKNGWRHGQVCAKSRMAKCSLQTLPGRYMGFTVHYFQLFCMFEKFIFKNVGKQKNKWITKYVINPNHNL